MVMEADRSCRFADVRNLAVLEQADVVHRIVTNDDFARYELAEDLTEHHHHLVCRHCGFTVEVDGPEVERWSHEVADTHGFDDVSHTVEIFGTCRDCALARA